MNTFLAEVRQTVIPDPTGPDGPLPPLLLVLTVITGLVDSFSYLMLGHVFVANMTGNVVFLAFALVGARGFSIPASAAALGSFALGAMIGGRVGGRLEQNRARLLSSCALIQTAFVAVAVVLAGFSGSVVTTGFRYGLIVMLAVSMGVQNAAARKLAVADLTTTVLTQTITGITADGRAGSGSGARAGRRGLTVVSMFAGALLGAALIVHGAQVYPLALALVLAVTVGAVAWTVGRSHPDWSRPHH